MTSPSPTLRESFHSHHAALGAFSTFTVGLVAGTGGFGHALRGPARQNVYVGFRTRGARWKLLPFFQPPESGESAFTGEEGTAQPLSNIDILTPEVYTRFLGFASDCWQSAQGRFAFCLLTPFDRTPDPRRMSKETARQFLSPHISGYVEYDNRDGDTPVELVFGIGDPDSVFRPLEDQGKSLVGFGVGPQYGFATLAAPSVEPRQGFNVFEPKFRDFRGLHLLGGESALIFTVPPGKKKRFPLVLGFFCDGAVTTGLKSSYAYTRFFRDLEDVLLHGLTERAHYANLAKLRDRELARAKLSSDQKFLIAQATHSYLGNTQLLWGKEGPIWVVNEGEYRMMNTFDLTVDHVFFELEWFPWAVRDTLDLFVSRYSYTDRVKTAQGATKPGGLSFTHDMGVLNHFTPPGHSSYECDNLHGCFSHMTMEQLLNWVICAACYGLYSGDTRWLRTKTKTLLDCAESLRRRDNPDRAHRDGILKFDSDRCGEGGCEITTYDSLDVSLGQARNNLYLSVKTLGAWLLLEEAFRKLKLVSDRHKAALSADRLAASIASQFDAVSQTFPAVFEAGNCSRIIPAVEGLAYPLFLNLESVTARDKRFDVLLGLLARHVKTILTPGVCLDAQTLAWKMSSTSTNTWFSKVALAQHVIRKLFPETLSPQALEADRVHAQWQRTQACGAHAMCDQIRSDTGVPCGSRYYPRGVTSILWMRE